MDANSGEPWSEMDSSDLKNELEHGRTIAETATFLCRDVYEVRAKMKFPLRRALLVERLVGYILQFVARGMCNKLATIG